jgi:hypothetical protein
VDGRDVLERVAAARRRRGGGRRHRVNGNVGGGLEAERIVGVAVGVGGGGGGVAAEAERVGGVFDRRGGVAERICVSFWIARERRRVFKGLRAVEWCEAGCIVLCVVCCVSCVLCVVFC